MDWSGGVDDTFIGGGHTFTFWHLLNFRKKLEELGSRDRLTGSHFPGTHPVVPGSDPLPKCTQLLVVGFVTDFVGIIAANGACKTPFVGTLRGCELSGAQSSAGHLSQRDHWADYATWRSQRTGDDKR